MNQPVQSSLATTAFTPGFSIGQGLFKSCQVHSSALLISKPKVCVPDAYLCVAPMIPPAPKPGLFLTECSWCHKPIWVEEISFLGNFCDNDCRWEFMQNYD